jgi:hypothetical protein
LHNPVFRVSQILRNPALCVSQIFRNPAFRVSNMTKTYFFLLCVINLANLSCLLISAAIWANPGNLTNPANPICLSIRVAILANLVNPVVVIQIFTLVRDLCSNSTARALFGSLLSSGSRAVILPLSSRTSSLMCHALI